MVLAHNCGLCVTHTLHDVYSFIDSLQHRGRDATGIAAIADNRIDVLKWAGPVKRFDNTDLHKIFSGNYHTFMAHVRYATRGNKDRILKYAHPITFRGQEDDRGDHVLISDCEAAIVHNGQVDDSFFKGYIEGSEMELDTEKLLRLYTLLGEKAILKEIPGAYTLAIADKKKKDVVVLRDRHGMKPGVLGWKDGKYVVASEGVAFIENGANLIENLQPGTAYYLSPKGSYSIEKVVEGAPQRACFFEGNYISHVLSNLGGVAIRSIRERLGEQLAKEFHPENADFVTFLPRCPEIAARSYANSLGLSFMPVFYKVRGERAFQGPDDKERKNSIIRNLQLLPGIEKELEGKTIICVDDSIVRGNNSSWARELLYERGKVKQAYLVSYTPKMGIIPEDGIARGCEFGVDMPSTDNFIARGRTEEEIGKLLGMPTKYISLEGMLKVFDELGIGSNNLCTYCIGGKYPLS